MSGQSFNTTDVLKLEVEADPTGLVNLIPNPSGELGGWGWITPVTNTTMKGYAAGTPTLTFQTTVSQAAYFRSEFMPLAAGQYVAGSLHQSGMPDSNVGVKARWEFYNSSRTLISSGPQTARSSYSGDGMLQVPVATAPANTAWVMLRLDMHRGTGNPSANDYVVLNEVTVAKSSSSGVLATVRTNLVPNPSFETNATGWSASYSGGSATFARTSAVGGAVGSWALAITANAAGTTTVMRAYLANGIPVTGGATYTLQAKVRAASTTRPMRALIYFRDSGGTILAISSGTAVTNTTGGWTQVACTATAPSGAVTANVMAGIDAALGASETHYVDAFLFEKSSTLGTYFDGSTATSGGFTHAWTGTAHASTSTATSSNLAFIEPVQYLNILQECKTIKVNREALNIGTLEAEVLSTALDPSQGTLIRPGRKCRLLALNPGHPSTGVPTWTPIFTGKVTEASVSYELKDPSVPDEKRARVVLSAVDATAQLANQKRDMGVATIAELPAVLEGCGVPWNVNGSGNQVPSATPVAYNENASALDQIAITRDTNLAHAWVDQQGVLQVRSSAPTYEALPWTYINDSYYTDLDVSYSTQDCINEVNIKFLRLNPTTGDTEEVPYGPYRNETSIAEWGVRSAEFTVQGIAEETSNLQAYANAILAANATPEVRINSLTMPVVDLTYYEIQRAFFDVYTAITVSSSPLGISEVSRITSVEHSIAPDKWLLTFGFSSETAVASPQFTPSPTLGAGGKTIGQLLRPVGEVTMYGGATAPAGWLVCNGASKLVADYPDLFAAIGYAHGGAGASFNLPNLVDRFPVGAGTKALGTSGGAATKVIGTANLPPHSHTGPSHTHGSGSLVTDNPGGHNHSIPTKSSTGSNTSAVAQGNAVNATNPDTGNAGAHTHAISGSTAADGTGATGNGPGSSTPLDVMNPWRAVNFIIRAV